MEQKYLYGLCKCRSSVWSRFRTVWEDMATPVTWWRILAVVWQFRQHVAVLYRCCFPWAIIAGSISYRMCLLELFPNPKYVPLVSTNDIWHQFVLCLALFTWSCVKRIFLCALLSLTDIDDVCLTTAETCWLAVPLTQSNQWHQCSLPLIPFCCSKKLPSNLYNTWISVVVFLVEYL